MTNAAILWPILWPSLLALAAIFAALGLYLALRSRHIDWGALVYGAAFVGTLALVFAAMPHAGWALVAALVITLAFWSPTR